LNFIGWTEDFFIFTAFLMTATVFFVILFFFKFHIQMVLSNMTTIENLDKKRSGPPGNTTNYDMGPYYNWVQVFGKN